MSEAVATSQQGLVGKYKPYPEYKDSGVEWLGEIPSEWQKMPLKRYCSVVSGYAFPSEMFIDSGLPVVRIGDIKSDGSVVLDDCKYIEEQNSHLYSRFAISPGELLMAMTGATIGKAGWFKSDTKAFLNQRVGSFRVSDCFEYKFLWYVLNSSGYQEYIQLTAFGGAQPNISDTGMLAYETAYPTINEQRAIAAFLDYETARIDRLIAQQQRLIELLKEKRQAVISHAVTKGLNPDAPMKDSGVEWLGQVPEHWNVTKFGFISNVVRGGSPRPAGDPELFDGDYSPWVTVAEITKDEEVYLESTESFLTEKGSKQSRVFKRGTLLLSNSGATLGVPKILSIDANANDGVVGFEKLSVNTEYAYFYLSTLTDNLRERIKQGSGQPNLNTDIVKSIVIPLPPSGEVEAILSEIKTHRITFSVLISKADTAIKLMQERRTALISAAVTGKIDLRGWTPPAEEAAA
ncbi:restriction endonuclease subunit S [Aeromonas veronii]|uniref:restriction endonuclease subunit S n=1 Tax=Aeromonas veronii TaxID=654 RepID=UPI001E507856|nr:restriction endonuclease subunit S [Aeromonas veronii]MCD6617540.1 restriction endonuclease subunit S [Aeromonas veronii]